MGQADILTPLALISTQVVQGAALGLASTAFYDFHAGGDDSSTPPSLFDCSKPKLVSSSTLPTGRFVRFRTTIEFEQYFKFELGPVEHSLPVGRDYRFLLRMLHIEEAMFSCGAAILSLDAVRDVDSSWEKPHTPYLFHIYREGDFSAFATRNR